LIKIIKELDKNNKLKDNSIDAVNNPKVPRAVYDISLYIRARFS